ncbi:MAG: CocE/NonD family hydrolase [Methanobacteriota archaeon]
MKASNRPVRSIPVLSALSLLSVALTGCIGTGSEEPVAPASLTEALRAPIPTEVVWDTANNFSRPLVPGPFDVLPVEVLDIPALDGITIASAVWRPAVPEGTKVPVILRISPYYFDFLDEVFEDSLEDQMFLQGLVPHGFAYARVAVRGTSSSEGCMEFFSRPEQDDMDEIVTFYGTQPWSNGNVGIWGVSYDGTTPWMAAMYGNPHLKTILPVSGLTSIYDHAYPNGTPVAYAPIFHALYWSYGFTNDPRGPDQRLANAACPEGYGGVFMNQYSVVTGDPEGIGPVADYWQVRDFRGRILENYRGSVFLIHGLQDWRVPPHMAFPFVNELAARGVETKILMGQWWHDVPDRANRGDHVRWDHNEVLLRWLTKELKEDATVDTGPAVDVEDNRGAWRTETAWPPADVSWQTLYIGAGTLSPEPAEAGEHPLENPGALSGLTGVRTPVSEHISVSARLPEGLRFAGSIRMPITLVPSSPEGARIYAELLDVGAYGARTPVAHAVMDLRYYEGTHERHRLTPGEPIQAMMEFFPADVSIPPDHRLELRIVNGVGYSGLRNRYANIDNFIEHPTPTPVILQWGDEKSLLRIPVILRDVGEGKYPGQP